MGHDQRFKEFLHAFLRDFLKLFYPHVEKRLDFENIEFLDTKVFTELHEEAGARRMSLPSSAPVTENQASF